jgi:hypothetical protein
MDKEIDAFIRKIKETNEDIVIGTVVGKLAVPDKGYLIRDRDGNEFIVECSEAGFGSKSYETIKFNEEVIIKGIIIKNIMIGTRRKSGFRKSPSEKTDKVKSRKVMMAFEVNSTGRTIGDDEGTILNIRQALGPL